MFLLDTVVLSEFRKKERNKGLAQWFSDKQSSELFVSVISIGEIERGIFMQMPKNPEFSLLLESWLAQILSLYGENILPITTHIAKRWGKLSTERGNDGADIFIAATALEYNLTIISRNERHFAHTGARCVNPWESILSA